MYEKIYQNIPLKQKMQSEYKKTMRIKKKTKKKKLSMSPKLSVYEYTNFHFLPMCLFDLYNFHIIKCDFSLLPTIFIGKRK